VKVFISFSTKDRKVAERLYADLVAAGAEVYQFGKSERAGVSSWEQVLTWINDSDVFIVLLSQSSLKSQPVKDEIDQASYSRSNSEGMKPAQLVPAIIETGVRPPTLIERFATLDLIVYETGVSRLIKQLGLKRASSRPGAIPSLPDFSDLFFKHKELFPEPRPATLWSEEAEKILKNYKLVKPVDVKPEAERKHLDALLAGKSSKYDALFLGFKPDLQNKEQEPSSAPLLKSKLLTHHLSDKPLEAPTLLSAFGRLYWTQVEHAIAYVVEESADTQFKTSTEVYRGPETEFYPLFGIGPVYPSRPRYPYTFGQFPAGFDALKLSTDQRPLDPANQLSDASRPRWYQWYRVKATGGVFWKESAWSNSMSNRLT
jgi:hypothetical protein